MGRGIHTSSYLAIAIALFLIAAASAQADYLNLTDLSDVQDTFTGDTHVYVTQFKRPGFDDLNNSKFYCEITTPSFTVNMTYSNGTVGSLGPGFFYFNNSQQITWTSWSSRCVNITNTAQTFSNTSNLTIFSSKLTISDEESSNSSQYFTTNQNISFTANFTDTSDSALSGASYSCTIEFADSNQSMSFASGNYSYSRNFSSSGTQLYNVSCYDSSLTVTNRTKSGSLSILPNRPFFNETFTGDNTELVKYSAGRIFFAELNQSNDFLELITIGTTGSRAYHTYNPTASDVTAFGLSGNSSIALYDSSACLADLGRNSLLSIYASGRQTGSIKDRTLLEIDNRYSPLNRTGLNAATSGFSTSIPNFPQKNSAIFTGGLNASPDTQYILFENNITSVNSNFNNLVGLQESAGTIAYLNNDTKPDVIYMGSNAGGTRFILAYVNNGTNFNLATNISGLNQGQIGCADFTANGVVDCFATGNDGSNAVAYFLSNDGSGNLSINASYNFTGLQNGGLRIVDLDNDGKLDIVYNGQTPGPAAAQTRVYINNGTNFTNQNWVSQSSSSFSFDVSLDAADYDFDGDTDLAFVGVSGVAQYTALWTNNLSLPKANAAPSPPSAIDVNYTNSQLVINFSAGSDDKTPTAGLMYNIRIGTSQYDNDTVSGRIGASSTDPGVAFGNLKNRRNLNLTTSQTTYYIQVQTIDAGLRQSAWSSVVTYEPNFCNLNGSNFDIIGSCTKTDQTIQMPTDGNITLYNASSVLRLTDVRLVMNNSADYASRINISGGSLILDNVTIVDANNRMINLTVDGRLNVNDTIFSTTDISLNNISNIINITTANATRFTNTPGTLLNSTFGALDIRDNISAINVSYTSVQITPNTDFEIEQYLFVTSNNSAYITITNDIKPTQTASSGTSASRFTLWERNITNVSGAAYSNLSPTYTVNVTKYQFQRRSVVLNLTTNRTLSLPLTASDEPDWITFMNPGSTNLTTLTYDDNLDSVSDLVINATSGRIAFNEPVNLRNLNLDGFVTIDENSVFVNLTNLSVNANVTIRDLTYNKTPIVFRDGSVCSNCNISSYQDNELNFTVPGFSTFSTSANSQLSVNQSTGSKIVNTTMVNFTASFTNTTSGSAISSGSCEIDFPDSANNSMSYNATSLAFEYNRTFSIGSYTYNVTCNATGYETLNSSRQLSVVGDFPTLFESDANFIGLEQSTIIAWSDRFIVSGEDAESLTKYGTIYNISSLAQTGSIVDPDRRTAFAVTDIDNDGDDDLVTKVFTPGAELRILNNTNGELANQSINGTEINNDLSIAIFDLQNDNLLDIVLTSGRSSKVENDCTLLSSYLLINQNGTFSVNSTAIPAFCRSSILPIDIDEDGWTDLIVSGKNSSNLAETRILMNNQSQFFTNSSHNLPNVFNGMTTNIRISSTENGFILSGRLNNDSTILNIYKIQDASIVAVQNLTGGDYSAIAVGDYTNDGLDDFIVTSSKESTDNSGNSRAYFKNGSQYSLNPNLTIQDLSKGGLLLYDYQNDNDLDLIATGLTPSQEDFTSLYVSDYADYHTNNPPDETNITFNISSNIVTLNWTQGIDDKSPSETLTYNVRLGDANNSNRFISGVAYSSTNPTLFFRGNQDNKTLTTFRHANTSQCYTYGVQVFDRSYFSSNWTTGQYTATEVCDGLDNDCNGVCHASASNAGDACTSNSDCDGSYCSFIDEQFDQDYDGFVGSQYSGSCAGIVAFDRCDTRADASISAAQTDCTTSESQGGGGSGGSGGGGLFQGNIADEDEGVSENQISQGELEDFRDNDETYQQNLANQKKKNGGDNDGTTTEDTVNYEEQQKSKPNDAITDQAITQAIKQTLIETKFIKANYELILGQDTTDLILTLKNNAQLLVEGINVTVNADKQAADHISKIQIDQPHKIIQENPIWQYTDIQLPDDAEHEIRFAFPQRNPQILDLVQVDIDYETNQEQIINNLVEQAKATRDAGINTTTTVTTLDNSTEIAIDIDFEDDEKVVENVDIIQIIPKCLLEQLQELEKDSQLKSNLYFEVIEADPVIRFHFAKLYPNDRITYEIQNIADQECLDGIKTLTIAQSIHILESDYKVSEILIPLLITIIVAAALLTAGSLARTKSTDDLKVQHLLPQVRRLLHEKLDKNNILKHFKDKASADKAYELITHHKIRYYLNIAIDGFALYLSFILITLAFLDVTENTLFTGDVFFFKIILSWVLMIYIFYTVSISQVTVGKRHRHVDKALLLGFFALSLKNLISYARAGYLEANYIRPLFAVILKYNKELEAVAFTVGIGLIVITTLFLTFKYHVGKKSLYNALYHEDSIIDRPSKLKRLIKLHLVILLFFVWAFSPMFEWLAVAVDSPIIMSLLAIFTILYVYRRFFKHKPQKFKEVITQVTEKPDHFYEHLIDLFHYPRTLLLGLSGIFVLNIITEIGIYLIPYIIGTQNPIYFQVTNDAQAANHLPLFFGHDALVPHFVQHLNLLETLGSYAVYALAWLGLVIAIITPALVWYHAYRHKHKHLSEITVLDTFTAAEYPKLLKKITKILLAITVPLTLLALISKVFNFEPILYGQLFGVDIQTQHIPLEPLTLLLTGTLIITILSTVMSIYKPRLWTGVTLVLSATIIITYNGMYSYSLVQAAIQNVVELVPQFQQSFAQIMALGFETPVSTWSTFLTTSVIFIYWFVFKVASLVGLYILGFCALLYMYIPTRIKLKVIGWAPFQQWKNHILLPHIHFHHVHDHHLHGHRVKHVKEYIENVVNAGHEPFIAIEHLYHKHWPIKLIEQAIYELGHEEKFINALHHVKKQHHENKKIHTLEQYLRKIDTRHISDDLFIKLTDSGWTENDIEEAMHRVHLPHNEHKLLLMAQDLEFVEKEEVVDEVHPDQVPICEEFEEES